MEYLMRYEFSKSNGTFFWNRGSNNFKRRVISSNIFFVSFYSFSLWETNPPASLAELRSILRPPTVSSLTGRIRLKNNGTETFWATLPDGGWLSKFSNNFFRDFSFTNMQTFYRLIFVKLDDTVKFITVELGYNDHGYNEFTGIKNYISKVCVP